MISLGASLVVSIFSYYWGKYLGDRLGFDDRTRKLFALILATLAGALAAWISHMILHDKTPIEL